MNEYNVLSAEIFYFKIIYERKSLSGAARQLNQDTANLSRMMSRLEKNLGSALFIRHKSGLHPTALAERLYSAVLSAMDSYTKQFLKDNASLRSVRIGFSSTIGFAHFSPKMTKALIDLKLDPEFSIDSSFKLIEKIKSRAIDFILVHSQVKFPGVVARKICSEDLVLCGLTREIQERLVLHPDMLGLEKIVSSISYKHKWLIDDYFVIAHMISTDKRLMGLIPKSLYAKHSQLKIIETYPDIGSITAVSWPESIGCELIKVLA